MSNNQSPQIGRVVVKDTIEMGIVVDVVPEDDEWGGSYAHVWAIAPYTNGTLHADEIKALHLNEHTGWHYATPAEISECLAYQKKLLALTEQGL